MPARPFGVKRGDTRQTASEKCPHIRIVHVDTVMQSSDGTLSGFDDPSTMPLSHGEQNDDTTDARESSHSLQAVASSPAEVTGPHSPPPLVTSDGTTEGERKERESEGKESDAGRQAQSNGSRKRTWQEREYVSIEKVSLERYREASHRIFDIFRRYCSRLERASVDEAYFDLTPVVEQRCKELQKAMGIRVADDSDANAAEVAERELLAILQDETVALAAGVKWEGRIIATPGQPQPPAGAWRRPSTVGDLRLLLASQVLLPVSCSIGGRREERVCEEGEKKGEK